MYVYKHRCRKPQAFGLPTLDMLIATKIVVVWKKTKPQIFLGTIHEHIYFQMEMVEDNAESNGRNYIHT